MKSRRRLARLAFAAAAVAVLLVLAMAGVRGSLVLLVVAVAGGGTCLAAAWWFLTHRGVRRWLAGAVLAIVPLAIAVMCARAGLVWVVVLSGFLWAVALAA